MDDVVNAIAAVNQNHVSADEDIAVAAGRGRQTAIIVIRNGVNSSPHIPIEHIILAQPGFVLGRQPVAVSKPYRWTVVVPVVPIARGLPIVVVELRMILPVSIIAILVLMILVVAVLMVAILIRAAVLCLHGTPT